MMDVNTTYLMNGGIEDRINRIHQDWGPIRRQRKRTRVPRVRRPLDDETTT